MSKADFEQFVETQINQAAQAIVTRKSNKLDDVGFGKLGFYLAVRRALSGTPSSEDLGLLDAVNDSLQALGLLGRGGTFLGTLKQKDSSKSPSVENSDATNSTPVPRPSEESPG